MYVRNLTRKKYFQGSKVSFLMDASAEILGAMSDIVKINIARL